MNANQRCCLTPAGQGQSTFVKENTCVPHLGEEILYSSKSEISCGYVDYVYVSILRTANLLKITMS